MSDFIFVDTGAWFAAVVPDDANHSSATHWFQQNQAPLITTDYIIDETLTLLRARGEGKRATALGSKFFEGNLATIHYLSQEEIIDAWKVFRQFHDQSWSFTDCTSKVVIERLGCMHAATFDGHFRQFGNVMVKP